MRGIEIHLACNNHETGNPLGYVENVTIGGIEPDLMLVGKKIACHLPDNKLWFGRLKITRLAYRSWYGNWCWDMVRIAPNDAARIVNYLKKSGWYCEGGTSPLFDKYEKGSQFTAEDFEAVE